MSNFKTVETFIPYCPLFLARETFLNITECKEPKSKMLKFVRFTGYIDEEEIHDGIQHVFVVKFDERICVTYAFISIPQNFYAGMSTLTESAQRTSVLFRQI